MKQIILLLFLWSIPASVLLAQSDSQVSQQEFVYSHKDGMALSMVVFHPKTKANGKGIVHVASGGWRSSYDRLPEVRSRVKVILERGYTVFAVFHGSVPKYTVPEIIPDIHRAIRFIRFHAKDYKIDPDHIGIMGGSAGGHLSLMLATADNKVDLAAKDPVDRVSSRVQAVACFFPPTDFLNFGKPGGSIDPILEKLRITSSFEFTQLDTTTFKYVRIVDPAKRAAIIKQISPVYQVTPDDPPVLLIHGTHDTVVPFQQSELMLKKLQDAKVPSELIVKKGADHGWEGMDVEVQVFADWFDKYLQ